MDLRGERFRRRSEGLSIGSASLAIRNSILIQEWFGRAPMSNASCFTVMRSILSSCCLSMDRKRGIHIVHDLFTA
jgi:hypothetical protein